jgi:hypothetical protein
MLTTENLKDLQSFQECFNLFQPSLPQFKEKFPFASDGKIYDFKRIDSDKFQKHDNDNQAKTCRHYEIFSLGLGLGLTLGNLGLPFKILLLVLQGLVCCCVLIYL